MRRPSCVIALALSFATTSAAGAQKTFVSVTGSFFRYLGDTIWMERDTTEIRVIYHGDTVIRRYSLNGRTRSEMVMVLRDGAAWTISLLDSTGTVRPSPGPMRSLPLLFATTERDMLARELQLQETMGRAGIDLSYLPMMPSSAITYSIAPATSMVHVRDTVLYITGCPGAARLDTTVFQLFGDDSTRRLSTPARTFGKAMALSLISQMRLSAMQKSSASRMSAPPPDLPGSSSGGCK